MSEKEDATRRVNLKALEEQPAAPVQSQTRRGTLRKKLWLVGLVATYCLARKGIMAWYSSEESWAYEMYESSLQTLQAEKTEKLFL